MPLVTHSINVAEVYAGIRPVEESITDNLLGTLTCFDLTRELDQETGELVVARRRFGRTHSLDDMIVAATAIAHRCLLVSDNRKDFEVPGIHFYSLAVE